MLTESRVTSPPGSAMPALLQPCSSPGVLTCVPTSLSRLGPASPTLPQEATLMVSPPTPCLAAFVLSPGQSGPPAWVSLSFQGGPDLLSPPRPTSVRCWWLLRSVWTSALWLSRVSDVCHWHGG